MSFGASNRAMLLALRARLNRAELRGAAAAYKAGLPHTQAQLDAISAHQALLNWNRWRRGKEHKRK